MQLTLLGTGCPTASAARFGPSSLVRNGGTVLLIDCGSGVTQRLVEAGLTGADIDALFVTHMHSDHLVDLYQLIVSSWHQGRDRPWRIFGPAVLRGLIDATMAAWREERELRIAFERRTSTTGFEIEFEPLQAGREIAIGDLRIMPFEVDHRPVEPAFGFRIEAGAGAERRSLVISGDTRRCDGLIEAAQGCDVLLHEVFVHRDLHAATGTRGAETLSRVASYHTLSSEVGGIAAAAGARALVLTHIVPVDADREALLAEARQGFDGPVVVGEDLMQIDLAARSLRYRDAVLSLG